MREKKLNSSTFVRLFATLFIVTLILSTIVLMIYEYRLIKELKSSIILEETIAVDTLSQVIGKDLKNVVSDLEFMNHEMLAHYDRQESLEQLWVHFLQAKHFYDQIRFIDVTGEELYRVNYNQGDVSVVTHEQLQEKSSRYYFEEAISLDIGQVYISKLDLNVENGEIEKPEKPMLRIALRVKNEQFDGIIVVNYLGKYLLNDVDIFNQNTAGMIYLTNNYGDYLYHEDKDKTFAFMYDDRVENFDVDYPDILGHEDQPYIIDDAELFIVKHLDFNQMLEIQGKKVISNEELILINHVYGGSFDIFLDTSLVKVIFQVLEKNKYAIIIIFIGTLLISYLQYRIKRAKILFTKMYEKDALTDIYNRRAGIKYLSGLIDDIQITREELCIVFIDVDGLKQINDGLGHEYGDDLLTTIIFIVKEEIREKDLLFRLGGDEFLLALMDIDISIADRIIQRVQEKLEYINRKDEKAYFLSLSYGISSTYDDNTLDMEELIRFSDERMYENKKSKLKRKMIKA